MGGLQIPADMMAGFAVVSSTSMGMQSREDGKTPVDLKSEYAKSGFDPIVIASAAAGLGVDEAERGVAALKLVGGQQHSQTFAAIDAIKDQNITLEQKHTIDKQALPDAASKGPSGPSMA